MNKIYKATIAESLSSVINLFLYQRLKKNRFYKTLLLSSILHSLMFNYHKLIRTRELFTRIRGQRLFGNTLFLSKRVYLTRVLKLSEKQQSLISDIITNQFNRYYFLNPYIPVEKWDTFISFITTPGSLENRLLKFNSEKLTVSSLDLNNLISTIPHIKRSRYLKKNWSYETLSLFFNFKFNFSTNVSTRRTTNSLLNLGPAQNYGSMVASMYKKLDIFLGTTAVLAQDLYITETFVNGRHTNPATFFLTIGDILSYKASLGNSDMSVAAKNSFINRKWVSCLHILFSLNRIYTNVMWSKMVFFFLKVLDFKKFNYYFFYNQISGTLFSDNGIYEKYLFPVGTTFFSNTATITSRYTYTIESVLTFSNNLLKSRFFTYRIRSQSKLSNFNELLDINLLVIALLKKYVTFMQATVLNDLELFNLSFLFNRWLGLNKASILLVTESLIRTFYTSVLRKQNGLSLQLVKRYSIFSQQHFGLRPFSMDTLFMYDSTFFLEMYGNSIPFLVGVDNFRSMQWSFFSNLKSTTLVSFSYIRWRKMHFEFILFYGLNTLSINTNYWLNHHDKVGSSWQYNFFLKYN